MIENTLNEIETRISQAGGVNAASQQELLALLGTLKAEIAGLAETHGEQARSIAGFAQVSAHEATRAAPNPRLRELSVQGLRSSAVGFEQSHPRLVQIINRLSQMLSDWGI